MLTFNWITEGHLDYEYKKYQVLAYLQRVRKDFERKLLYPAFSELLLHYKNLKELKDARNSIKGAFKKNIQGIAGMNSEMQILYSNNIEDPDFLNELDQILEFSLPQFLLGSQEGKKIFEEVAAMMNIQPVGIRPKNISEGYWLLFPVPEKTIDIYRYKVGFYTDSQGSFRSLETSLSSSHPYTFQSTPENLKLELIRQFPELPNPAVYTVQWPQYWPQKETLLPVLKRVFMQQIAG